MECNHCEICFKNKKCDGKKHYCKDFIDESAINDMKPTEWKLSKK